MAVAAEAVVTVKVADRAKTVARVTAVATDRVRVAINAAAPMTAKMIAIRIGHVAKSRVPSKAAIVNRARIATSVDRARSVVIAVQSVPPRRPFRMPH